MQLRASVLLFAFAAGAGFAAEPNKTTPDLIQRAFTRLYNFDFPNTYVILSTSVAQEPSDPLPYAVRASAYLFSELNRLGVLESQFFIDDERIAGKKKLKPDPALRNLLLQAVSDAQQRADARLARGSDDPEALFAHCIAQGILTDYTALVEKKQFRSLGFAKQSQVYANRLLKIDPKFYDAYLTNGVSEYLLGSLPFFVRWFVKFDQVQGSKEKAVRQLQLVARSGHYLGPFAKILLAIIHLREKRPADSERLLVELTRDYPENPLLRHELTMIRQQLEK